MMPISQDTIDLLGKGLGYAAIGLAGWLGGRWKEKWSQRDERKQMRKRLYREIASNYGILYETISNPVALQNLLRFDRLPNQLEFRFFEHAQTDMNTFYDLADYQQICDVYGRLSEIRGFLMAPLESNRDLLEEIERAKKMIEEAAVLGWLNKRLLLKQSPRWIRDALKVGVRERAEALPNLPLAP